MQNFPFAVVLFSVNNHFRSLFMKMSEIKELSATELNKKFRELGEELLQLQIRKQTGQVEKPHLIKSIRRERARILMVITTLKTQTV